MQYIPPLIFSACGLVDPAITAILSWAIGVESLPTLVTWIGGFTVMTGVGVISLGDHYRTEEEHKQAAAATADTGSARSAQGHVVDGSEIDSDVSSKSSGSESGSNGSDKSSGITMSVLHSGRRFVDSTRTSDGPKYSILGTDDEEDGEFDRDIEQGSSKSDSNSVFDNDAGLSDSTSDVNLTDEEQKMLQFIRSKTSKQQDHGHQKGFAEV